MADKTDESGGKGTRRYLSPLEFCQLSGLSLATVHRYLKSGKLPFWQPGGHRTRILIPVDALEALPGGAAGMGPAGHSRAAQGSPPISTTTEKPAPLPGPRPKWTRLGNRRS